MSGIKIVTFPHCGKLEWKLKKPLGDRGRDLGTVGLKGTFLGHFWESILK